MRSLSNTTKEVYLDLSKSIKFGKAAYISLGTFLISLIIMLIQLLAYLSANGWIWNYYCFLLLLNFFTSLRGNKNNNKSSTSDTS